jgi:hypothetical protein
MSHVCARLGLNRSRWLFLISSALEVGKLAIPLVVGVLLFLAQRGDIAWYQVWAIVLFLLFLIPFLQHWSDQVGSSRQQPEYLPWKEAGAAFYNALGEEERELIRQGFMGAEEAGTWQLRELVLEGRLQIYGKWGEETEIEKLPRPEQILGPVETNQWGTPIHPTPKILFIRRVDIRTAVSLYRATP